VVYIAPLKALVRERVLDWSERVCPKIGRRLVELTGDLTPDLQSLQRCACPSWRTCACTAKAARANLVLVAICDRADVIVTTPEKWDSVSRSWQTREYVRAVSLVRVPVPWL
jgi:replicative superfamily II helicase